MKTPVMAGIVERRLLVNYRTDPDVTARLPPAPLRGLPPMAVRRGPDLHFLTP